MAPDLGLDLKLSATKIVTTLSKEASSIQDDDKKIAKLEEYVQNLEDERRKIEVFKRELPLCMFLLNDVIGGMREEMERCQNEKRHVLEEFMPIKSKLDEERGVKSEKDCKDKMNWMSSAQLWSDNYSDDNDHINNNDIKDSKKNIESGDESDHHQESETPSLESKSKSFGGAFVPFKSVERKEEVKVTGGLPDLSLVSRPVSAVPEDHRSGVISTPRPIARCQLSPPVSSHVSLQSQQQGPRKARRCWSPELHRRFVVALQQLGGAQVATPKQIRELMKVDGLTNDEVKSHLQKYRLHTRRVPNSSSSANRPVMVMGGLWVPQEHCTTSQQSGSPQGPLQLAGSLRAISVTAGDSCEDDGKSESYSWK